MSHALGIDSVRDTVGSGPGVVLWRYREPPGSSTVVANPFAEWAGTTSTVLYRRSFNVVRAPSFRFPTERFLHALPGYSVAILHDPEIVQDMLAVLPEIAKACLGANTRLVLVSESSDFLDRCAQALDPLSDALPVQRVGAKRSNGH